MEVILSTRNPSKAKQIRAVFADSDIKIKTLEEAGIEGEGNETGETLEENALIKAQYAHDKMNPKDWTMADDSGIFITALDGKPGVKSARWAGDEATTSDITKFTLDKLRDADDRSAKFRCVVALISPTGEKQFFSGEVNGRILEGERCEPQPKMPYSGIFEMEGSGKVWAEMTTEEENAVSHRGNAFTKVRDFLLTNYTK